MTARARIARFVLAVALAAPALHASAAQTHPAQLAPCDFARDRGRRDEALACYRRLLSDAAPLVRAESLWALGDRSTANTAFRDALKLEPESAWIRARWGRLYLETHQIGEAEKLFREALAKEPKHLEASLGLITAVGETRESQAHELAEKLGREYPDDAAVQLALVRVALEQGSLDRATERLAAVRPSGESEADGCGPRSLELYALRATIDLLGDEKESPATARALACNPRYGAIHATPAYFLANKRRYAEASVLLEQAVKVEPELWSAHHALAVSWMRENRIDDARRALEIAYKGDPFSAETVNLLRLLDQLGRFEHIVFERESASHPGLELRLDPREARLLAPYLRELTAHAVEVFTKKYGFTLQRKIVLEMYPNHDDFAVRTAGLPGLGILGATFGYLVAMDSPSSRRLEENFHWGNVLWHELSHVFALEATDHRVPRWFTEGLSVYEEWATGPAPQRMLSDSFLAALREGKLLPVRDLDRGFERPSYPDQIAVSYMQAGLVCELLAQRDPERLTRLLRAFGKGMPTGKALDEVLGDEASTLDAELLAHARKRAGARLTSNDAWRTHRRTALAALEKNQLDAALASAALAIELEPDDVIDRGSAYLVRARAFELRGDEPAMIAELERYRARGGRDPSSLSLLATALYESGRRDAAIEVLSEVRYVEPQGEALHEKLGEWLLEAGQGARAQREFEAWLALEPHDRSGAEYGLARAQQLLGRTEEAKRLLLALLERTPRFRPAQRLLLELSRGPDVGSKRENP